jgi:hypothetical protein
MRPILRSTQMAILGFLLIALVANLAPVRNAIQQADTSASVGVLIAGTMAALFLVLAFVIWVSAIRHFKLNQQLVHGQRAFWRVVVYGGFVFGAIAYALRFMGRSPSGNS